MGRGVYTLSAGWRATACPAWACPAWPIWQEPAHGPPAPELVAAAMQRAPPGCSAAAAPAQGVRRAGLSTSAAPCQVQSPLAPQPLLSQAAPLWTLVPRLPLPLPLTLALPLQPPLKKRAAAALPARCWRRHLGVPQQQLLPCHRRRRRMGSVRSQSAAPLLVTGCP